MTTLIQQLKFEEGLHLSAYRCPAGRLTIGYGHNLEARPFIDGERIPNHITEGLADELLARDIEQTEEALTAAWHGMGVITDVRREACVNMAFQLGVAGFMALSKFRNHLMRCEFVHAYREGHRSSWAKQTPHRADRVLDQILSGERYKVPLE